MYSSCISRRSSFHIIVQLSATTASVCEEGQKNPGKWNLSLLLEHMEDWIPENSGQQKWRHPRSESDTQSMPWLNFLFLSAADIGFLHASHMQEVSHSCSPSPWVTRGGGGQISSWNFNLLQLNYLISKPATSKEYLSCRLPDCLDGRLQSALLRGSPLCITALRFEWLSSEILLFLFQIQHSSLLHW